MLVGILRAPAPLSGRRIGYTGDSPDAAARDTGPMRGVQSSEPGIAGLTAISTERFATNQHASFQCYAKRTGPAL